MDFTRDGETFDRRPGGEGRPGQCPLCHPHPPSCPAMPNPGRTGESRWLRLELKLLPMWGSSGFPTPGSPRSSLQDFRRAAQNRRLPLHHVWSPQSGSRLLRGQFTHFVIADIPGIIEGAHRGSRPWPDSSLRHVAAHFPPPPPSRPLRAAPRATPSPITETLNRELALFDPELSQQTSNSGPQ
jgi:GTPase